MSGGELAVVVGASGALGGAIAARLLAEGLTVIGVARGATGQRATLAMRREVTPPAMQREVREATRPAAVREATRPAAAAGGGDAASGAAGGDAQRREAGGDAASGAARGGAAGSGAGAAGSSAAMEWCAADIGSDDAVAAIAAAVGDRPVRMVVQAAGLPAAGPLATIEPDALGRAVALKCGGLLRLVRAVDGHLQPGAADRRARRPLRHRARPVRLRGRRHERGAGQPRAPARDRLRAPRGHRAPGRARPRRHPAAAGALRGRRPRRAACPSTPCWPNGPPSRRSAAS